LEGVLHEVTEESVAFDFEGTRADVPRHKVEGVIYFHRAASRLPDPTSRVLTVDGAAWNFKSCELDGETLKGVSVGGVRLSLLIASLAKIDFSVGNLVFLSRSDSRHVPVEAGPRNAQDAGGRFDVVSASCGSKL